MIHKQFKYIRSLAMLKMEKNFIAHISKKYPRYPYSQFTSHFLLKRIREQRSKLRDALDKHDLRGAMLEIADISNILDFLFERLCELEVMGGELVIPNLGELLTE